MPHLTATLLPTPAAGLPGLLPAMTSPTSNATLHTLVLGLIMVVGTGLAIWLLKKYGGPR